MTVRFSEGLRNNMLGASGLQESFTNGVLNIYSGVQPSSANAAAQGTLLITITLDGGAFTPGSPTNGLNFDAPLAGVISKAVGEVWSGIGLTDGLSGWARLSGNNADTGAVSITLPRIDLSIAQSGGDLNLSNTSITSGAPTSVGVFQITMLEA